MLLTPVGSTSRPAPQAGEEPWAPDLLVTMLIHADVTTLESLSSFAAPTPLVPRKWGNYRRGVVSVWVAAEHNGLAKMVVVL